MPKPSSFYFSFPTAIGNAYAVLSNANKRRQYDQCGDEKSNPSRQGPAKGNFEPDISPEDLFNMFFGGGYPQSECSLFSSFLDVVFMHPSVNIYFIYLGHANGYTNGRMRNPRRERRERQGDVSSLESRSYAKAVMQRLTSRGRRRATAFSVCGEKLHKRFECWKFDFLAGRSRSLCASHAHPHLGYCVSPQPNHGQQPTVQPELQAVSHPYPALKHGLMNGHTSYTLL